MKTRKDKYFAGGKGFHTKKDLVEFCKVILNTNMGELKGDDLEVIKDVLKMHPRYEDKVGDKGYTILVDVCPVNPRNNIFQVLFDDKTMIDFSYHKAIKGYSPETKLKETLRASIRGFHERYRENYIIEKSRDGYLTCEETGLKIRPKEMHLDHYPLQFEELVANWMKANNLKMSDIKINPPEGYGFTWVFEDSGLLDSFVKYHNSNVKYRGVKNTINLQRPKSKVKLPK